VVLAGPVSFAQRYSRHVSELIDLEKRDVIAPGLGLPLHDFQFAVRAEQTRITLRELERSVRSGRQILGQDAVELQRLTVLANDPLRPVGQLLEDQGQTQERFGGELLDPS
jgi:hypothetical protein